MDKKYALVTGGSSGIGLAIARLLAQRGYALLLVSNQPEKLDSLKRELSQQYGTAVETYCMDLAQPSAAEMVYRYTCERQLEVEVLVNNAGFFFFGQAADADIEQAKAKIQLHVLTLSLLCTLFAPAMRERRKGYILNLSSIAAYKDFPGIAYYGATKAYIKSFSRSLHAELKVYNVHVTALCPGATATDLYDPAVINVALGKKLGIMMDPHQVAKAGVKGLFNNQAVVIPGVVTQVMLRMAQLIPYRFIYLIRKYSGWLP